MKAAKNSKKEKEVKCGECDAVLSCSASLSRHKKTKHSQQQSKTCTICHKEISLKRKDNFRRHVLLCTNRQTKQLRKKENLCCMACNKTFLSKQHLQRHEETEKHKEKLQPKENVDVIQKGTKARKRKLQEWEDGYVDDEFDLGDDLPTMIDLPRVTTPFGTPVIPVATPESFEPPTEPGEPLRTPVRPITSSADLLTSSTVEESAASDTTSTPTTPKRLRKRRTPKGTPRTEKRRTVSLLSKRKCKAAERISKSISSSFEQNQIPNQSKADVVIKALSLNGILDDVLKETANDNQCKARGITRTANETIQTVWSFWNEHSTVSNAQTSRPAKCSAKDFDSDPLLKFIDKEQWNFQTFTTKRQKVQYHHQYHVQSATKHELFKIFKRENPNIQLGITTFSKLKPFYVRECKPCDIETCTCRKHVNFRNAIQALLKDLRAKEKSMKVKDEENEIDVLSSYHEFMRFLYLDCNRDDHGLLKSACESGECGEWNAQWEKFKKFAIEKTQQNQNEINTQPLPEDSIAFQRFEYTMTEKFGRKLAECNSQVTLDVLLEYISGKLPDFVIHSNSRSQDYLFWKVWLNVIVPLSTLFHIDYSENLSLPVQKEPQSMYWIRKQISLHCEIVQYTESGKKCKVYSGHMSDDRDHDQVYVKKSLDDLIDKYPVDNALIIRSDNAQHFKSAESFSDMQDLSNKLQKPVIRVYGTAGHGKGEIDSCGGHLKNPVRNAIANNVHIISDKEAADYLMHHYADKTSPSYDISTIDVEFLQEEREKRIYIEYSTVKGSDSFHVLVFTPGSETFLASAKLCVCNNCLDMRFQDCNCFEIYTPVVARKNEKITRSKSKSNIALDVPELSISQMVTKGSIFAIRAENAVTNYFLLICTHEEEEHLDAESPFTDECGNAIHFGTKFIRGHYLNCRNFNDKYHEFSAGNRAKLIAVNGDTVFFPQVPVIFISKGKTYYRIGNDIIHELQVCSALAIQ